MKIRKCDLVGRRGRRGECRRHISKCDIVGMGKRREERRQECRRKREGRGEGRRKTLTFKSDFIDILL